MNNITFLLDNVDLNVNEEFANKILDQWLQTYDRIFPRINYELLLFIESQYQNNDVIISKVQTLKQNIIDTYINKQKLINRVFSHAEYYNDYTTRIEPKSYSKNNK